MCSDRESDGGQEGKVQDRDEMWYRHHSRRTRSRLVCRAHQEELSRSVCGKEGSSKESMIASLQDPWSAWELTASISTTFIATTKRRRSRRRWALSRQDKPLLWETLSKLYPGAGRGGEGEVCGRIGDAHRDASQGPCSVSHHGLPDGVVPVHKGRRRRARSHLPRTRNR